MVEGLIAGETAAAALAALARGKLRAKQPDRERALTGRMGAHQRFRLARHLAHSAFRTEQSAQVSEESAQRLRPVAEAVARLDTIPVLASAGGRRRCWWRSGGRT